MPAIGIAYTEKYYDYYNYIGLSEYVIGMNDLTGDSLIMKYQELLRNKTQIINMLKSEIPKQQKMAKRNAELVAAILKKEPK